MLCCVWEPLNWTTSLLFLLFTAWYKCCCSGHKCVCATPCEYTHFYLPTRTFPPVTQKTHILCMWHLSQDRLSSISSPWSLSERSNILWLPWGEAGLTVTLRVATGNAAILTLCASVWNLRTLAWISFWSSCQEVKFLCQVVTSIWKIRHSREFYNIHRFCFSAISWDILLSTFWPTDLPADLRGELQYSSSDTGTAGTKLKQTHFKKKDRGGKKSERGTMMELRIQLVPTGEIILPPGKNGENYCNNCKVSSHTVARSEARSGVRFFHSSFIPVGFM